MDGSKENKEQEKQDFKKDYIMKQFQKTDKKTFENYCISRIYHLLRRDDICLVTQQAFRRAGHKKVARADAYFPQINVWIEIDEGYHKNQEKNDFERTEEIKSNPITYLEEIVTFKKLEEPERIQVYNKSLAEINARIDEIVTIIQKKIKDKEESGAFKPWREPLNVKEIVKMGRICVSDDAQFHTISEVSELFGKEPKKKKHHTQQACFRAFPNKDRNKFVWCPKLRLREGEFENNSYLNEISCDRNEITEKRKKDNDSFVKTCLNEKDPQERFVFAKCLCSNGRYDYKFVGVFQVDKSETENRHVVVYKKVSDELDLAQFKKQVEKEGALVEKVD